MGIAASDHARMLFPRRAADYRYGAPAHHLAHRARARGTLNEEASMSDWAVIALVSIAAAYKLVDRWLDARSPGNSGEVPPPGNDTLVETPYRDPARDDGERRIPDITLGFQPNER